MAEYFQAKRELLMEGDSYGDMVAAYPAYWSGLRCLELGILMDMQVLGHIWQGQIIWRDPQIEAWAAAATPNVGALQKLLSRLEDQRAVWLQIRAFQGSESRGQRTEEDNSEPPPWVTKVEVESYLKLAADQDQGPGAGAISVTSDQPGAPSQPGKAEQDSPDARSGAGEASGTRAAVPGAPPAAARGELEPGAGGDPQGVPQPRGQEGQPATGEERATGPSPRVQGFSGGRERADQQLKGEPPSTKGG